MSKINDLLNLLEAKATALKDADFGIHGFVHKGDVVKIVRSGPDHYILDLGKSRFSHPKSLAVVKLTAKQFQDYFNSDAPKADSIESPALPKDSSNVQ